MAIITLNNNALVNADVGKVLQVVQTVKTDTFTTTSGSLVDVTGLSLSITPSSTSSKIMIVSSFIGSNSTDSGDEFQLVRDTTNIGVSTGGSSTNQTAILGSGASTAISYTVSIMFLDNPSTTSTTTYKVQARRLSGTLCVGRNSSGTRGAISTITAYEIAG
jgi:hypothetical protein